MNGLDAMEKKQIPIIALAVFSISLLSMFAFITNPHNQAYAVTLITKQWNSGSKVENTMFYDSERGIVLICSADTSTIPDTREIHNFDAETLASVSNKTSAVDDNQDCDGQNGHDITCTLVTDACYRVAVHSGGGAGGGANPAGIMLTKYSLIDGTTTTYTNTTYTSAALGKILAIVGSLAYFSNSGGALPQGVWTMNIATAFDGLSNDDQTLFRTHAIALPNGFQFGCYDALTNNIITEQANVVGKIDVSTGQFTSLGTNLGAVTTEVICFDSSAWFVSSAGGWVKKINPSSGALSATITLAGAITVMKHGDLILIGSGTTVYAYENSGLTQVGTYTGFTGNAVKILRKNATAFYFMGNSERIHLYNGLPDDGSGDEEDEGAGNQQDGFCGNGTLRDCLGDQNALSGLTPPNQNITTVATTIGQGIGLINPNDENPRTNGTGLWLMLITGSFFAIALMSTVHTLNMRGFISASVKEIDPIFWLFLVVATVSIAWYLDWIDDIIFFAMTVGLAGLVAFGVLKHFGRV